MPLAEFKGELTGRLFRYDFMQTLSAPGNPGTSMSGHHQGVAVESGEPVYIRVVKQLDADDNSIERVRRAIEVARTPAVIDCQAITRLIDYRDETVDVYGFGDNYEVVTAVWEWGERVLLDELTEGGYDPADLAAGVAKGIGTALACLHGAGLVHSDVAPNNIVRVGEVWKLADLDTTVREHAPVVGLPKSPRFVLNGIRIGDPARREMDEHGLRAVLDAIRSAPSA